MQTMFGVVVGATLGCYVRGTQPYPGYKVVLEPNHLAIAATGLPYVLSALLMVLGLIRGAPTGKAKSA